MPYPPVDAFMKNNGINTFYVYKSDFNMRSIRNRPLYQIATGYYEDAKLEDKRLISVKVNEAYDKYSPERYLESKDFLETEEETRIRKSKLDFLEANDIDTEEYMTRDDIKFQMLIDFNIRIPKTQIEIAAKDYAIKHKTITFYLKEEYDLLSEIILKHYKSLIKQRRKNNEIRKKKIKIFEKEQQIKKQAYERRRSQDTIERKYFTHIHNYELNYDTNVPSIRTKNFFPRPKTIHELELYNRMIFKVTAPGDLYHNDEWLTDKKDTEFKLFQAMYIEKGNSFRYNEFCGNVKAFCKKYTLMQTRVHDCLKNPGTIHRGWIFRYIN